MAGSVALVLRHDRLSWWQEFVMEKADDLMASRKERETEVERDTETEKDTEKQTESKIVPSKACLQ